jgi:hypothetical protein
VTITGLVIRRSRVAIFFIAPSPNALYLISRWLCFRCKPKNTLSSPVSICFHLLKTPQVAVQTATVGTNNKHLRLIWMASAFAATAHDHNKCPCTCNKHPCGRLGNSSRADRLQFSRGQYGVVNLDVVKQGTRIAGCILVGIADIERSGGVRIERPRGGVYGRPQLRRDAADRSDIEF